jgi:predicted acetyltransferase
MRDAFLARGENEWTGRHALAHTDIPAWIAALNRRSRGEEISPDWVPETHYWVVTGGEVVGDLELRHPLDDWLTQVGGNIGYGTHPNHRGRGIAAFALREGLRILRTWGLEHALATCRDDNVGSIKVIERAGGVRIQDARYAGPKRRRYLIPTQSLL